MKLKLLDEYLQIDPDEFRISPIIYPILDRLTIKELSTIAKNRKGLERLIFNEKNEKNKHIKFKVIGDCSSCNKETTFELFKNGLIDYLHNGKSKCKDCIKKSQQISIEEKRISNIELNEKFKIENEINIKNNTINYINKFCNPNNHFKSGVTLNEKWYVINYSYLNWDDITKYLNELNYKDFLKTPYWNTVSFKRKAQAKFSCQLCNSKEELETHHSTYDIRGKEIFNMNKLTVLCHRCHNKHHKDN